MKVNLNPQVNFYGSIRPIVSDRIMQKRALDLNRPVLKVQGDKRTGFTICVDYDTKHQGGERYYSFKTDGSATCSIQNHLGLYKISYCPKGTFSQMLKLWPEKQEDKNSEFAMQMLNIYLDKYIDNGKLKF